ncbi:MAG: metallophosphoesterase [Planctomycetota bacterium]|nr:metallophosphoesterase [Planctomycetota bacterium]MDA1212359.1 metallophosphoesterase [Planctomycetota bacterium]
MRALAVTGCVAAILLLTTAWSKSNSFLPQVATVEELEIDVEELNPWTNLDINNQVENFQFAIVTDRTGGARAGIFESAIPKINLLQPEFVISVGDLIEGGTEDPQVFNMEWTEFEGLVKNLEMPFFYVPGNHDISNVPMQSEWARRFGRSYYSFKFHDVLFICLNSEDEKNEEKRDYYFSQSQRDWLKETLAENSDVRWTCVFVHKPAWTYDPAKFDELGWTDVEESLQGRGYTVFSGHRHKYQLFERHGMEYYMLATTGGGSKLRGKDVGEFDHVVWVTIKDKGPVLANLMLDGIEPKDIGIK